MCQQVNSLSHTHKQKMRTKCRRTSVQHLPVVPDSLLPERRAEPQQPREHSKRERVREERGRSTRSCIYTQRLKSSTDIPAEREREEYASLGELEGGVVEGEREREQQSGREGGRNGGNEWVCVCARMTVVREENRGRV